MLQVDMYICFIQTACSPLERKQAASAVLVTVTCKPAEQVEFAVPFAGDAKRPGRHVRVLSFDAELHPGAHCVLK